MYHWVIWWRKQVSHVQTAVSCSSTPLTVTAFQISLLLFLSFTLCLSQTAFSFSDLALTLNYSRVDTHKASSATCQEWLPKCNAFKISLSRVKQWPNRSYVQYCQIKNKKKKTLNSSYTRILWQAIAWYRYSAVADRGFRAPLGKCIICHFLCVK